MGGGFSEYRFDVQERKKKKGGKGRKLLHISTFPRWGKGKEQLGGTDEEGEEKKETRTH